MKPTRRVFLQRSLVASGALATAPSLLAQSLPRPRARSSTLPPHPPRHIPGVHAYADAESVRPGDELIFRVSNEVPVRATLCRLGTAVDDPGQDAVLHDFGTLPARVQPIHPGSYVHVARGLSGRFDTFTAELWVRPWRVDRPMGLISQHDTGATDGFSLELGPGGSVVFQLDPGRSGPAGPPHRTADGILKKGVWHYVVARWDGRRKEVWVDGQPAGWWPWEGPFQPGSHPLRLGALGEAGRAVRTLDGDIAMVALCRVALDDDSVRRRHAERGLIPPGPEGLLGFWSLSEESGDRVADGSRFRRHGRIINQGTWMIGGPSFDASVPRFGDYSPDLDPQRGHGLRLASDDLYDCRWEPSLRWRVPNSARSGMAVLRLQWERDGATHVQHATFIIRRARRRDPAPILLLAATHTWRAYNAAPFGRRRPGYRQLAGTDGLPNEAGDPPAFSFYRGHAAGQGTYQMGTRVPWPAADPYLRYGDATDYSHLARADRFTQAWLEQEGYDYEMISDLDLHRDPGSLRRHRVLIINGHSEYWSIEMFRGLEEYLGSGGRVVVLSGNTLFWRVSWDAAGTVLECRKVDAPGDQLKPEQRGEAWHSHDHLRGGLLRECGFPGWKLIGLETLGWNNQGNVRNFGPWIAEATDHPVFHSPEPTGLQPGDRFGWAGEGRVPMANGHEFDVRLSTLAALASQPLPEGATMPSDPPGIQRLANGVIPWQHGGAAFDYFFRPIRPDNEQGGEMIWWERPEGGTVFHAGTIGAGWALGTDPRWAALLRNVLHRFGVARSDA